MKITWLGNASFKIVTNENKVIYIDPYSDEYGYDEFADLVLVSNSKYDHCARDKIRKITGDDTKIFTCNENSGNINGKGMNIDDENTHEGIIVKATKATSDFYSDAIGFLIKVDNKIIYFAGSTKELPDINIPIDIAMIPIGGTYVMNPKQAAYAVEILKARIVIPMHYGSIVGNLDDADYFLELLEHFHESDIRVIKEGDFIEIYS